jgi:CHRD domain
MKRTIALVIAAALALAGGALAEGKHKGNQGKSKPERVTICHRTLSKKHPTVTITISERAWKAHSAHGDVKGACGAQGVPRGFTRLTTTLTPVAGATGSGSAVIDVKVGKSSAHVCFTLLVTGVAATAAHIHTATAMTLGGTSFAANAIVVPLKTPKHGSARGCTQTTAAIGQALIANPSNFYVNVHSAAFPNGQLQGTL